MKKLAFIALFAAAYCNAQTTVNRTVHFYSGKDYICCDQDIAWLESIAAALQSKASYSIDIKAYCDAVGTDEMNAALAERRAAAVKKVLNNRNLKTEAIHSGAFGESDPIGDNSTEAGKAMNRRAVVTITYEDLNNKTAVIPAPEKIEKVLETVADNPSDKLIASNLKVGKTLILRNMNFEGGTAILLPESGETLKELLTLMKENPTLEIEIGGHVCCGPDLPLSIARAKRVYNYLAGYGISEKRMRYKGYSFDKPLNPDRTPEQKSQNRRVEITVLKL